MKLKKIIKKIFELRALQLRVQLHDYGRTKKCLVMAEQITALAMAEHRELHG